MTAIVSALQGLVYAVSLVLLLAALLALVWVIVAGVIEANRGRSCR